MRLTKILCAGLLALPWLAAAQASVYPDRPVTFIVPFAAGGPTDLAARLLSEKLADSFGQPFVVQNRAGATGLIGQTQAMRAKPDGYTLLIASNSSHILAPLSQPKMPYDPVEDFAPISLLGQYPLVLNVFPDLPANSVDELISLAKKRPGQLNFGSVGAGSVIHMTGEQFKKKAGLDILHIPYNGTPPMTTALMAGEIEMHFNSVSNTKPLADGGRVRALAVTGDKRAPLLPNVPTLAEIGMEGVDAHVWLGALAPKGTPQPILEQLQTEIRRILENDPALRKVFHENGFEIVASDAATFAARIGKEQAQWKELMSSIEVHAK
ncbi:tripartite tricarboxylate transporter substrate binding protein [Candidimonas sp. SYP-B2681]|uniref:Bug family tripartite tricarboxylate transporter substrate binding protein n=1 Tax=Candidimonas sp. SYP-B2681 TaxID=2497686 RepID=UPI000F8961E4|nr:tripartite tricarboxylate transporter substrate binding protein [Candidimonas sp. SYP-B2681]RTZ41735.1 tripartite tricarboxylate transporter substrate binding protein [Candidimonas sp. SYP-B2681]